jgi:hypothetical protein
MPERKFSIPVKPVSDELANFLIGFAALRTEGKVEDAESAGSGTLVTVGSFHGVLTAAHVIDRIVKEKQIGIVRYLGDSSRFDKQILVVEHTDNVVMRTKEFLPTGPDLGFLRLPEESLGWLKAKNSFYNLTKRREHVLLNKCPAPAYMDSITGMIHEFTKDAASEKPSVRRKVFTAIFGGVVPVMWQYYFGEFELYYYRPTSNPDFELPKSFEGTSGGAVWRLYPAESDGRVEIIERRLLGVPFHQSRDPDGERIITCHGPRGIYGRLVDKVTECWPEGALAT